MANMLFECSVIVPTFRMSLYRDHGLRYSTDAFPKKATAAKKETEAKAATTKKAASTTAKKATTATKKAATTTKSTGKSDK